MVILAPHNMMFQVNSSRTFNGMHQTPYMGELSLDSSNESSLESHVLWGIHQPPKL